MQKVILVIVLSFSTLSYGQTAKQSPNEIAMLKEINMVRTDPKGYIKYIDAYTRRMGVDSITRIAAGLKAKLRSMKPLPPLQFSETIYTTVKAKALWLKKKRVQQHPPGNKYAENIFFGEKNVRTVNVILLIDYNVPGRGHRNNILNPKFGTFACKELTRTQSNWLHIYIMDFYY